LSVQHNTAFEGYCQGATLADITHGQDYLLSTRGPWHWPAGMRAPYRRRLLKTVGATVTRWRDTFQCYLPLLDIEMMIIIIISGGAGRCFKGPVPSPHREIRGGEKKSRPVPDPIVPLTPWFCTPYNMQIPHDAAVAYNYHNFVVIMSDQGRHEAAWVLGHYKTGALTH